MTVQKQSLPIVLTGMDTKTDDKNLVAGQLVLAKNMVMNKTKKWQNRKGYAAGGASTYPDAKLLLEDSGTTMVVETDNIHNIGTSVTVQSTKAQAQSLFCASKYTQLDDVNYVYFTKNADSFVAVNRTGTITSFFLDGALVWKSATTLEQIFTPQAACTSATAAYFIMRSTGATIKGVSASGVQSWTVNTSDVSFIECITDGGVDYVCIVYKSSGVKAKVLNTQTGTVTAAISVSAAVDFYVPSIGRYQGKFRICVPTSATNISRYDITTGGVLTSTTAQTTTGVNTSTYYPVSRVHGLAMISTTSTFAYLTQKQIVTDVGDFDTVGLEVDVGLTDPNSEAFTKISLFKNGSQILPFSFGYPYYNQNVAWCNVYSSATEIGAYIRDENVGVIKFDTTTLPTLAPLGGQTYTNLGGTISVMDKQSVSPSGFYACPTEITSAVQSESGFGSLTAGTYQFFLAWTYTDSQNKKYYSPTTPIFSTTLTAPNNAISIRFVEPIARSAPPSEVFPGTSETLDARLGIGMTQANGSNFFFQEYIGVLPINVGWTLTSVGGNLWPFQGGILESGPLVPARAVGLVQGRIFAPVGTSNSTWMFSTKATPTLGPRFPAEFRIVTSASYGASQIAAEMDNKAILFHEYGIFATWGDGPDETGANGYPPPALISQGVGCKFPRSVVLTDSGLMFMSHEGIFLLTKSMQIQYIGKDVEAYNGLTITGAHNLTDRHQVWFYSQEGTTLCYDEFHQLWSVFDGQGTKASSVISGTPAFVRIGDGKFLKESAAAFNDAGTTFSCELKSGWLSLAGVQGFQRVYRMMFSGNSVQNATLTLWRDWSTSSFETFTIPSSVQGQWQVRPAIQKCEAMQFDLLWSNITGAVEVSAFAAEAGMKQGQFRVAPATNRVKGN